MRLSDVIKAYSRSLFKLNIITFDLYDILFALTTLPNYPVDDDNHIYELDNYGFMEITDTKIVYYCGGDWQSPIEITVELVNNMPTITSHRLINDFPSYIEKELSEESSYELLDLPRL